MRARASITASLPIRVVANQPFVNRLRFHLTQLLMALRHAKERFRRQCAIRPRGCERSLLYSSMAPFRSPSTVALVLGAGKAASRPARDSARARGRHPGYHQRRNDDDDESLPMALLLPICIESRGSSRAHRRARQATDRLSGKWPADGKLCVDVTARGDTPRPRTFWR